MDRLKVTPEDFLHVVLLDLHSSMDRLKGETPTHNTNPESSFTFQYG